MESQTAVGALKQPGTHHRDPHLFRCTGCTLLQGIESVGLIDNVEAQDYRRNWEPIHVKAWGRSRVRLAPVKAWGLSR